MPREVKSSPHGDVECSSANVNVLVTEDDDEEEEDEEEEEEEDDDDAFDDDDDDGKEEEDEDEEEDCDEPLVSAVGSALPARATLAFALLRALESLFLCFPVFEVFANPCECWGKVRVSRSTSASSHRDRARIIKNAKERRTAATQPP